MRREASDRGKLPLIISFAVLGLAALLQLLRLRLLQHLNQHQIDGLIFTSVSIEELPYTVDSFASGLPMLAFFSAISAASMVVGAAALWKRWRARLLLPLSICVVGVQFLAYYLLMRASLPLEYFAGLVPAVTSLLALGLALGESAWRRQRVRKSRWLRWSLWSVGLIGATALIAWSGLLSLKPLNPGARWTISPVVTGDLGVPIYWLWLWGDSVGMLLAITLVALLAVIYLGLARPSPACDGLVEESATTICSPQTASENRRRRVVAGIVIGVAASVAMLLAVRYRLTGSNWLLDLSLYSRHVTAAALGAMGALFIARRIRPTGTEGFATGAKAATAIIGALLGLLVVELYFRSGHYTGTSVPRSQLVLLSFPMMLICVPTVAGILAWCVPPARTDGEVT